MANYCAQTRTNYFAVTDEAKFRAIVESCGNDSDGIQIFDADNGARKFGFGCSGSLSGIPENPDDEDSETDIDAFYAALQSIVAEGDAIIITEIGYENLRYLVGVSIIITRQEIRFVNLLDEAMKAAREALGNVQFTTQMDY